MVKSAEDFVSHNAAVALDWPAEWGVFIEAEMSSG